MIPNVFCAVIRHRVNGKKVWWDGLNFRTNCTTCGRPLLRADEGWRPFDDGVDAPELSARRKMQTH